MWAKKKECVLMCGSDSPTSKLNVKKKAVSTCIDPVYVYVHIGTNVLP